MRSLTPGAILSLCLIVAGSAPAQTSLYVTGGGINNLLAVVDPASKSITGFLQSPGNTSRMAVTPGGSRAYFTDPFDMLVTVVDLATDTRLAAIPTAGIPVDVALNYDGTRVYVSLLNSLQVIDTGTNTVIGQIPIPASVTSIAASVASPRVYVGGSTGFWVIDTTTDSIISSIPVLNMTILAIRPSPDGSRAYLCGRDDANGFMGYLMTVDLGAGMVTGSIAVGSYPSQLALTPDGSRVYVSLQGAPGAFAGALVAVDIASGQVIGAVSLPGYGGAVAVEPGGTEVYVAVGGASRYEVDTISTATNAVSGQITGFWALYDLVFVASRPIANYEAEATSSALTGKARVVTCSVCSSGAAVTGVGEPGSGPTGGALTITNVSSVGQVQADLSVYYQHTERAPITAAVIVNSVTHVVRFPPVESGASPSRLVLIVPGQNINTVTITGVQGTPSSSLTIDRVTLQ